MGWLGNIANSAKKGILGKNTSPNQLVEEKYIRQPAMQGVSNSNSLYVDEDENGIDDRFETKQFRPGQDISGIKRHANPKTHKPFSFKGKNRDYNVSYNDKGHFVPTATYPLPPVSHQQKLLDRNRRMRNKENKFI